MIGWLSLNDRKRTKRVMARKGSTKPKPSSAVEAALSVVLTVFLCLSLSLSVFVSFSVLCAFSQRRASRRVSVVYIYTMRRCGWTYGNNHCTGSPGSSLSQCKLVILSVRVRWLLWGHGVSLEMIAYGPGLPNDQVCLLTRSWFLLTSVGCLEVEDTHLDSSRMESVQRAQAFISRP